MFLSMLLFFASASAASTYQCKTVFGENVPIRKFILKSRCEACESYGAPVPKELLQDSKKEVDLNISAELEKGQSAHCKRKIFVENGATILLDTRYLTQPGGEFVFHLECSQEGKCKPSFSVENKILLKPRGALFNKSHPLSEGELSLQFTSREGAGFLARIRKVSKIPGKDLSSSGEIKLYREDDEFSFDLGVDEQFELMAGAFTRIAAIEAKVVCKKK